MDFNSHSDISGKHAFLSPSSPHWLNCDEQKLEARFYSYSASVRGTDLHALAHEAIRLGMHLDPTHGAIAAYVADALTYRMTCEVPLYYSENAYGHADTLSFWDYVLRIHDLKTGITPSKPTQLEVYGGLFCLEYGFSPFDIQIETRIYQGDEATIFEPPPERIQGIMDTIVRQDRKIQELKEAERWR
jgi:hypothetical protein